MAKSKSKSKKRNPNLSGGSKIKKWWRMVLLLTFKKYGGRILSHLFFAYLIMASVRAMHTIWQEFAEFKDCQDEYIKFISTNVSSEYNEAAEALAQSALDRAKCIMGALNLNLPPPFPDIKLGSLPKSTFDNTFGWFNPERLSIPRAELNVRSNTQRVVRSIFKDVNIFLVISMWTRYAGFILAGISIILILATATYYTMTNKTWKPSVKSHIFRLIQFIQVVCGYKIAVLVIVLQAYATNKFCQMSIYNAELKTPECSVVDQHCDFSCKLNTKNYPSPCTRCTIKLHWWWIEPFSMPNIFAVLYVTFMLLVLIFECFFEAAVQRREYWKAKQREREERRMKRIRYEAKKKAAAEKELQEQLIDEAAEPPVLEDTKADADCESDPPTETAPGPSRRRRKKKSGAEHPAANPTVEEDDNNPTVDV